MSRIFVSGLLFFAFYSAYSQNCGVPKIGKGNVFGGNFVTRGQYPWYL